MTDLTSVNSIVQLDELLDYINTIKTAVPPEQVISAAEGGGGSSYPSDVTVVQGALPSSDISSELRAALEAGGNVLVGSGVITDNWGGRLDLLNPLKVVGMPHSHIQVNFGANNQNIFKPKANDISFEGIEWENMGTGTVNFIDFSLLALSLSNIHFKNNVFRNFHMGMFCNDSNDTGFTVSNSSIMGNHFYNCGKAAVRLSGLEMRNFEVAGNWCVGSKQHGFYVGYLANSGELIHQDEIQNINVHHNWAMDINPDGDPGSEGSYGFYVSGSQGTINHCVVVNHFSTDGAVYSNFEPIYMKARRAKAHTNVCVNCTANQGMIAIKGMPSVEDSPINGDYGMAYNNIFHNDSQTGAFANSVGFWMQSENSQCYGNIASGLSEKFAIFKTPGGLVAPYYKAHHNTVVDFHGSVIYQVNGDMNLLRLGDNDTIQDVKRTESLTFAKIGGDSTVKNWKIGNVDFVGEVPTPSLFNIVEITNEAVVTKLSLKDIEVPDCAGFVKHTGTINVEKLVMMNNDFSRFDFANYSAIQCDKIGGTGYFPDVYARNNEGFMTIDVSSVPITVPAGGYTESPLYDTLQSRPEDIVFANFDLPSRIYAVSSKSRGNDSSRILFYNTGSSDEDLTAVTGRIVVEKVNGVIEGNT